MHLNSKFSWVAAETDQIHYFYYTAVPLLPVIILLNQLFQFPWLTIASNVEVSYNLIPNLIKMLPSHYTSSVSAPFSLPTSKTARYATKKSYITQIFLTLLLKLLS